MALILHSIFAPRAFGRPPARHHLTRQHADARSAQNEKSISQLRGEFQDYDGVPLMPTFNPAYLLRDPTKKREVWEDMKKVRALLAANQSKL